MNCKKPTIKDVDALLPQTQCELCEFPGCKPYATAIIENNERIDKCLPGGVDTLKALGKLLDIDPTPYVNAMEQKQKPALIATIREAECIGCVKCINACPVDAIIGSGKKMHTVLSDACNGCELCIEPCPVDCINLIELPPRTSEQKQALANQSRQRFDKHQQRLQKQRSEHSKQHQQAKLTNDNNTLAARKAAIAAAIARVKQKKESA